MRILKLGIGLLGGLLLAGSVYAESSAVETVPTELLFFAEIPTVSIAAKSEESLLAASGTVYVITEEDIKRYGWRDMKDILKAIPNMDLMWQYNWLNGGQRGFTGNFSGTLLLIDGREVQNLLASEAFMTNDFPAHRIKRVEVLQGPNSTLYGGNATQGVINIVTKFGDKEDKDVARAEVLYGEVDTEQVAGVYKKNGKDWELGFSASEFKSKQNWKKLAEFAGNNDLFSRSPKDPLRYNGVPLFRNSEQSWTVDLYARFLDVYGGYNFFKETNTAGLEYVKYAYNNNEARRGYRQVFLGYRFSLLAESLKGFVEYQNVAEDEQWILDTPTNAGTATSFDTLQERVHSESFEDTSRHRVTGQLDYTGLPGNHVIVGYDWWRLKIDDFRVQQDAVYTDINSDTIAAGWPVDKETTNKNSVFAQDTFMLLSDALKITLGIRYNKQDFTNDSVLPRASVVYMVTPDSAVKLTYGRAFRPPNIFEYQGMDNGVQLDSQVMNMGELNYSQNATLGGVKLTNIAAAYVMEATNLYSKVYVGGGAGQLSGWKTQVTSGAFKVRGFEDMLRFGLEKFTGFVGFRYALPDKTRVADQDVVKGIPLTKVKLGLAYDFLEYLSAGLFVDHWAETFIEANKYPLVYTTDAAGQAVPETEVYTVPAWTCINLNLNVGSFKLEGAEALFSLSVENLLDTQYYHGNVRGTSPVQFLQPPRTFLGKVTFTL